MKRTAFDLFHPVVAFGYVVSLFVFAMTALQPVYVAITFVSVLAYGVVLRGWRAPIRSLVWQLPVVILVALANVVFSASGFTELFRIGARAFYLESLVYGACMGAMLASVLVLFANASHLLTSDKIMVLFGGIAPTIGLMLSMTARLVPQFVRRGADIADGEGACTAAYRAEGSEGKLAGMRTHLRRISVLMGWSMEDSLETASAMKARGWGAVARRTTYARYHFRHLDAVALIGGGALALLAAIDAGMACSQFRFYPTIGGLAPWWSYVPYALYACLPLVMSAKEYLRWRA